MAVPFGFSVGDFVTVGKLIGQVITELRENGEASTVHQHVVIELETLQRALGQLESLKPAKHELRQLAAIRATVAVCKKPLQDFLHKISKFEARLGAFNAVNQKWKGFPRRMQFKVMFKDDIEELRRFLSGHIATINILLMTQTVSSITLAESERHAHNSNLENRILANRKLIQGVGSTVDLTLKLNHRIHRQISGQQSAIDALVKKEDDINEKLRTQTDTIQEVQTTIEHAATHTKSLLSTTAEILELVSSGLMHIRQISQQLCNMLQICADFTSEMRAAVSKALELFINIHTMLQRIERSIPTKPQLPIVKFTTAFGETMVLPYQVCQRWSIFTKVLKVLFEDKPGNARVLKGMYLIMNTRGGRFLREESWSGAVLQDDHLSMSITLDDLEAKPDTCAFPTCQSPMIETGNENGGRTYRTCGRWTAERRQNTSSHQSGDNELGISRSGGVAFQTPSFDQEDIELYRHVSLTLRIGEQPLEPQDAPVTLPPPPSPSSGRTETEKVYRWICHECGGDNSYYFSQRCTSCYSHELRGCSYCNIYETGG